MQQDPPVDYLTHEKIFSFPIYHLNDSVPSCIIKQKQFVKIPAICKEDISFNPTLGNTK